jgi:hypothetical protein
MNITIYSWSIKVLATKATPSGFDLDKGGGTRGGLVVGVPGIVMAAVSADDASKPSFAGGPAGKLRTQSSVSASSSFIRPA